MLLRLTSTAICGTDLHIYEGRLGDGTRMVIGHEPLGVVERMAMPTRVRVGDRVTVPTHICCGFCPTACRLLGSVPYQQPRKVGRAYGYPGMGGYTGAQSELLRVPFGDANCLRLPGEPGDRWEHDFVLLADALPTAYHATELARIAPGDTVVIYGAGAIGLLTTMCAFMRGALKVYVVDAIPERLDKAIARCTSVDMRDGHAVDRILEQIARDRGGAAWRGEEANLGATVCIDAMGFKPAIPSITRSRSRRPSSTILRRSLRPTAGSRSSASSSTAIERRRPRLQIVAISDSVGNALQEGRRRGDGSRSR